MVGYQSHLNKMVRSIYYTGLEESKISLVKHLCPWKWWYLTFGHSWLMI